MAEKLTWLLELDAQLGGATAMVKKLAEIEASLGHADVATSKTEQKMASAGHAAAKMGQEVAGAHQQSGKAAGEHDAELKRLRATLDNLKKPGEIEKLKHEITNFGHAAKEAGHHVHDAAGAGGELRNVMRDAAKIAGFRELSKAIDETKHTYQGLVEFGLGVVLFEGLKEGIEMVTELGSEIVKTAAEAERTGKVFANNLGVEGGKEALEYAEKYGENTEFSRKATKAFAAELLQAGVPLEKLDVYMAAAGDVAAKSINKMEGMAGAVSALDRATRTGKLEGRALRGLHLGIPQMKELEEFKGKSDAELKGILEDGELTTNQVLRMIAGRDNVVGDQAVEMGKTMDSQLTHLGELPERYFEKFADSPAFETLKGKLGEIIDTLDPDKQPGSEIFASLSGAFSDIVGEVAKIDFVHVADVIRDDVVPAIKEMTEAIGPTLARVEQFINGMRIASRLIAHPVDTISEIASTGTVDLKKSHQITAKEANENAGTHVLDVAARNHITDTESYDPLAASLAKNVNGKSDLFGIGLGDKPIPKPTDYNPERPATFESAAPEAPLAAEDVGARASVAIDKNQSRFETAGLHAASGYISGMRAGTEEAAAAGGELAEGALAGTAKAQESHSPSRKFRRLGGYAADGYTDGIDDGEDTASRAAAEMGQAAIDAVPSFETKWGRPENDTDLSQPLFGARGAAGYAQAFSPAAPPAAQAAQVAPAAPVERKIEINVTVPISMSAGARTREVDDMIAKLRTMLPGTLQAAVEALAIEGGV